MDGKHEDDPLHRSDTLAESFAVRVAKRSPIPSSSHAGEGDEKRTQLFHDDNDASDGGKIKNQQLKLGAESLAIDSKEASSLHFSSALEPCEVQDPDASQADFTESQGIHPLSTRTMPLPFNQLSTSFPTDITQIEPPCYEQLPSEHDANQGSNNSAATGQRDWPHSFHEFPGHVSSHTPTEHLQQHPTAGPPSGYMPVTILHPKRRRPFSPLRMLGGEACRPTMVLSTPASTKTLINSSGRSPSPLALNERDEYQGVCDIDTQGHASAKSARPSITTSEATEHASVFDNIAWATTSYFAENTIPSKSMLSTPHVLTAFPHYNQSILSATPGAYHQYRQAQQHSGVIQRPSYPTFLNSATPLLEFGPYEQQQQQQQNYSETLQYGAYGILQLSPPQRAPDPSESVHSYRRASSSRRSRGSYAQVTRVPSSAQFRRHQDDINALTPNAGVSTTNNSSSSSNNNPAALYASGLDETLSTLEHGTSGGESYTRPHRLAPVRDPDPKYCDNCHTTSTPSWRRCPQGQILLCNACGLYQKLHGRSRPFFKTKDGTIKIHRTVPEHAPCVKCGTRSTTIWRKDENNKTLCNACSLALKQARTTGKLSKSGDDAMLPLMDPRVGYPMCAEVGDAILEDQVLGQTTESSSSTHNTAAQHSSGNSITLRRPSRTRTGSAATDRLSSGTNRSKGRARSSQANLNSVVTSYDPPLSSYYGFETSQIPCVFGGMMQQSSASHGSMSTSLRYPNERLYQRQDGVLSSYPNLEESSTNAWLAQGLELDISSVDHPCLRKTRQRDPAGPFPETTHQILQYSQQGNENLPSLHQHLDSMAFSMTGEDNQVSAVPVDYYQQQSSSRPQYQPSHSQHSTYASCRQHQYQQDLRRYQQQQLQQQQHQQFYRYQRQQLQQYQDQHNPGCQLSHLASQSVCQQQEQAISCYNEDIQTYIHDPQSSNSVNQDSPPADTALSLREDKHEVPLGRGMTIDPVSSYPSAIPELTVSSFETTGSTVPIGDSVTTSCSPLVRSSPDPQPFTAITAAIDDQSMDVDPIVPVGGAGFILDQEDESSNFDPRITRDIFSTVDMRSGDRKDEFKVITSSSERNTEGLPKMPCYRDHDGADTTSTPIATYPAVHAQVPVIPDGVQESQLRRSERHRAATASRVKDH